MSINATPRRYTDFNEAFNLKIDEALKEKRELEREARYADRRPSLGGSRLGKHCERALGYEWHQAPKDEGREFKGRLYRIFDRGHDGEERMIEYLKLAGFMMKTQAVNGGQIGFMVARDPETGEPRIKGFADGIIFDGPDEIAGLNLKRRYSILWENKILKHSRFCALRGLTPTGKKASKPGGARENEWEYYVQCNVYMAYLGLDWCLFTAVSADTMEIHAEVIELDTEVAQAASDKGVRVVTSQSVDELPRVASSVTDERCRWCDFKERCWAKPKQEPAPTVDVSQIANFWGK